MPIPAWNHHKHNCHALEDIKSPLPRMLMVNILKVEPSLQ